jgi:hypothetical protein
VSKTAEWIAAHMADAPPVLRERAMQYVPPTDGDAAERLARAAGAALDVVLAHAGGRGVALDLLAADGLITLALLAKANAAPAELDAFAASLMRR